MTGKLGQSLRKYTETVGQPDFELEKFAINSLLSATHTAEMDAEDQKDIINKVKKSNGGDDKAEPQNDDQPIDDLPSDEPTPEPSGEEELQETMTNLFVEPKKNNMFQPGSNDKLNESCWKGYKQVGMKDKGGKQVPNCVPINEGNTDSNNYMFWQNLTTLQQSVGELLGMEHSMIDSLIADGHAWAADHVATSADDIEEVYHFVAAAMKQNKTSNNNMGSLEETKKNRIFSDIKKTLRETFNQDDMKTAEPTITPEPTTKPVTVPTPEKPSRKNKPFLPMPNVQPDPKAIKEGKHDYEIYHKTLSSALNSVEDYVAKFGYDKLNFDINDIQHVAYGQTARIKKELTKGDAPQRKMLNAQIYRMDNGTYELNMYIS